MAQDRFCSSCGVSLSSDLSNCPLCGKHCKKGNKKTENNPQSYPHYDFKYVNSIKWYNKIRGCFWAVAFICVIVNLIFPTKPYWFPYVLAGLVMIFHVFIEPIKVSVKSYIKNLNIMSIVVGLFMIFIDAYNSYTLGIKFGWALSYASPMVMLAGVIASSFLCFFYKKQEVELLNSVSFIAIYSVIYFLIVFIFFKPLPKWPSLAFMCAAIGFVILIQIFKRNKLIKQLRKEFHI